MVQLEFFFGPSCFDPALVLFRIRSKIATRRKNINQKREYFICPPQTSRRKLKYFPPRIRFRGIKNGNLKAKIQQTKMLVTCQMFGDWFLFGLVWPYSSNQKNIMKVGSKSLLLTCSSNRL